MLGRKLAGLATIAALVGALLMPGIGSAHTTPTCESIADTLPIPGSATKATLCHFTGSDSNPFVINEVSLSAVNQHRDHHGDCVRYFDGTLECF